MSISAIENLLQEAMGLDSQSIGSGTVQRVISHRMRVTGTDTVEGYFSKVVQNTVELQELIDAVTVPETWFFRDKDPFDLFAQVVSREWLPPSRKKVLRVLSIPCATGEEPYSIAMILKDLGFNSETVKVDAVDISMRSIAKAVRGIYGANSFRGEVGTYLGRYFAKTDEGYELKDVIKKMVNIQHGNLIDNKFLSGSGLYDVIFCRNVLIYFRRTQQDEAIKKLHRILSNNGILFVGHAEGGRLPVGMFSSMRQSGTFAFRKKVSIKDQSESNNVHDISTVTPVVAGQPDCSPKSRQENGHKSPKLSRRPTFAATGLQSSAPVMDSAGKNSVCDEPALEQARILADKGRLAEAARFCEDYLAANTISADGYYLLGLIRQAEGKDANAGELFRKVVYLNPRHYQALVHLAAQAELSGNWAAAAVYRSRATRVAGDE